VFEIGNSLREARVRRQLDFRQVEQATKVRSRYLLALEVQDIEDHPAETNVRGFLRSYADYLGLDGQLFVDEYNSRFVTGADVGPLRPRRSPAKRTGRGLETNVILFALTAIAVMTALVIAAWKFSAGSSPSSTPARVVPKPALVKPRAQAQPTPRAPTKANVLVRAVRGNCWLEVHAGSASGRLLYQGTLERGQSQRFIARSLWVNAGVPENLSVRLNGDPVAIGANSPVVVLITANSITPAQPQP
jgi:cytoskeleton protein RodZ